jgi:hypothetical protein
LRTYRVLPGSTVLSEPVRQDYRIGQDLHINPE